MHGGESVVLSASDPGRYDLAESIEPDSWDAWNADRDQALTSEAAAETGAAQGLGDNGNPAWSDLDANGDWYNVPDQGYVWSPYEAANTGFDPYGSGYWMWMPRYGYMWVSGYSWGYLPFQCGMWNYYNDFGWGWAPGAGGCSPWWRMGFYGGPNIGMGFTGYRPPAIPRRRRPDERNGANGGEQPRLIAVNRRPTGGAIGLPVRDRAMPVTIAGHTVQPLRPLSPRPAYQRSAPGFVTRPAPGYTVMGGEPRTAAGAGRANGYSAGGRAGYAPAPKSSGGSSPRAPSSGARTLRVEGIPVADTTAAAAAAYRAAAVAA